MTRAEWEALPRPKQLRIIHKMQEATVAAWLVKNITVERMLSAFFDETEKSRKA